MRGGGWSLCAQGFRASGLARCRERASMARRSARLGSLRTRRARAAVRRLVDCLVMAILQFGLSRTSFRRSPKAQSAESALSAAMRARGGRADRSFADETPRSGTPRRRAWRARASASRRSSRAPSTRGARRRATAQRGTGAQDPHGRPAPPGFSHFPRVGPYRPA